MFVCVQFRCYHCCVVFVFFLMIRRPPRSTPLYSSAASDVYKRQISLFEGPHTGKNFLTTEMINKIKKEKANFLRLCFVILTCILPIYMIIQEASLIIDSVILKASFFLVLIFALIGMLIERYLFFIQAKHVVSLYYGEKKV